MEALCYMGWPAAIVAFGLCAYVAAKRRVGTNTGGPKGDDGTPLLHDARRTNDGPSLAVDSAVPVGISLFVIISAVAAILLFALCMGSATSLEVWLVEVSQPSS